MFLMHHFNHVANLYEKPALQVLQTLLLVRAAKILSLMFLLPFFKIAVLHYRLKTHPTGAKGSLGYYEVQMYLSLNETLGTRCGFLLE